MNRGRLSHEGNPVIYFFLGLLAPKPLNDEVKEHDDGRAHDIEKLGMKILRFTNEEVLENIDVVKRRILREISSLSPLQGVWGQKPGSKTMDVGSYVCCLSLPSKPSTLLCIHRKVDPAFIHQLIMSTCFSYGSLVEHNYSVGQIDIDKAVTDQN